MFMISVLKTNTYLTLVDIQKILFYYDCLNKKVLGKVKDELNGVRIAEFVGLQSKMYSLISSDNKETNKAKGVNKKLRHKEYVDVQFNKKSCKTQNQKNTEQIT